jgi:hypothetical protein
MPLCPVPARGLSCGHLYPPAGPLNFLAEDSANASVALRALLLGRLISACASSAFFPSQPRRFVPSSASLCFDFIGVFTSMITSAHCQVTLGDAFSRNRRHAGARRCARAHECDSRRMRHEASPKSISASAGLASSSAGSVAFCPGFRTRSLNPRALLVRL